MTTSRRCHPVRSAALGDPDPTCPGHRRPEGAPPGRAVTNALLAAAGRGDVDAFATFYDLTASVVVGLLHGVLGRPEQVASRTEEVYLGLWCDAPRFDPTVCSADATLLRAARRALITPVRRMVDTPEARPPAAPATSRRRTDDGLK